MKKMILAALLPLAAQFISPVAAQTPGGSVCPYIAYGAVLTPAQWNYCFQIKQDYIGYVPVNKAGDTMQGELITFAASSAGSGLNLQPGSAPTVPNNGDMWLTASGIFFRTNGVTYQVATSSGGPLIVTSSSANALAVGPNGATNPSFNIDTSMASAATGLNVKSAAAGSGLAVSVLSSATNDNLKIDAKGSGTITLGGTSTGNITIGDGSTATVAINGAAVVLAGASTTSLVVGALGTTNPTLQVDDSTTSAATGLLLKSAAAGSGMAASVLSSGSNENLTLDAKGTGSIKIGTVSTGGFGFNVGSDATGDMYYRNSSGLLTRIPVGSNSNVLTLVTGLPTWQPGSAAASVTVGTTGITSGTPGDIEYNNGGTLGEVAPGNGIAVVGGTIGLSTARRTLPTTQTFLSASGTYTVPANVLWIELYMVGGGAGGASIGAGSGAGTAGGNSCWNTSGAACTTPVYQAGGGSACATGACAGGVVSGSSTCTRALAGGAGGTMGGASYFGGAGAGFLNSTGNGSAAATNSGSGGGGGSNSSANNPGGGAGAYCYTIINSPAASYTYAVGTGGAGNTSGGTAQGGAGAPGMIQVVEHYGS